MQENSELNIQATQRRRHAKTAAQPLPQTAASVRPEAHGLSREEIRKIVADLLG